MDYRDVGRGYGGAGRGSHPMFPLVWASEGQEKASFCTSLPYLFDFSTMLFIKYFTACFTFMQYSSIYPFRFTSLP